MRVSETERSIYIICRLRAARPNPDGTIPARIFKIFLNDCIN